MNDKSTRMTVFSAKAANGVSDIIDVSDLNSICIKLAAASGTTGTVKIMGALASSSDSWPAFGSVQSFTNHFDYVAAYDYNDGTIVSGDTGVAFANTTQAASAKILQVNVEMLDFVALELSGHSAGSVSAEVFGRKI